MYLSDLIRPLVNKELKSKCIGRNVTFAHAGNKITIVCKDVNFCDDDGDCWIEFTDENGEKYFTDGQGIDIWFDID